MVRNVLSQHTGMQKTYWPHATTSLQRGCVYISGSLTLRKLQTARGKDHSCSEASTIILWVSPFPAVFSERKRPLWNTEFKPILPFYTFWILPDKPAKMYALLLNHFQHFQQERKGHSTIFLRPISLRAWRKTYAEWNFKAWRRVSTGKHKTGPRKKTDPNPFLSRFLKGNYFNVDLAMGSGQIPHENKRTTF